MSNCFDFCIIFCVWVRLGKNRWFKIYWCVQVLVTNNTSLMFHRHFSAKKKESTTTRSNETINIKTNHEQKRTNKMPIQVPVRLLHLLAKMLALLLISHTLRVSFLDSTVTRPFDVTFIFYPFEVHYVLVKNLSSHQLWRAKCFIIISSSGWWLSFAFVAYLRPPKPPRARIGAGPWPPYPPYGAP